MRDDARRDVQHGQELHVAAAQIRDRQLHQRAARTPAMARCRRPRRLQRAASDSPRRGRASSAGLAESEESAFRCRQCQRHDRASGSAAKMFPRFGRVFWRRGSSALRCRGPVAGRAGAVQTRAARRGRRTAAAWPQRWPGKRRRSTRSRCQDPTALRVHTSTVPAGTRIQHRRRRGCCCAIVGQWLHGRRGQTWTPQQ